jgi:hypothetical protein
LYNQEDIDTVKRNEGDEIIKYKIAIEVEKKKEIIEVSITKNTFVIKIDSVRVENDEEVPEPNSQA